jgi:pyruvate/2-oxoglutarate dehydrogenase complex dihydrolipoamide acyltransferase (E2) component
MKSDCATTAMAVRVRRDIGCNELNAARGHAGTNLQQLRCQHRAKGDSDPPIRGLGSLDLSRAWGRIFESDVLAALSSKNLAGSRPGGSTRIPFTARRRLIADRLRRCLSTTALVKLTREVDAEAVWAAREAREQLKVGF